ncbi:MAG: gamma-glutamyl-gamma-aminobutyrate hydrolase family protein [Bacteroidota bacterium]
MSEKNNTIGITRAPDKGFTLQFLMLQISVLIGGGRPLTLQAFDAEKAAKIDGLLVGGGRDVYPGLYHEAPIPGNPYSRVQDDNETRWIHYAKAENMPVLAICRGAQLLNVIQGGSVHHKLTDIYENADYPQNLFAYNFFRKKIHISGGSLLHKITGKRELMVNSIHKRAIDKPGAGMEVTAREENGIIQAIEHPGLRFFMGVQFHPERLIYRRVFRNMFRCFVKAAGMKD